MDHGTVRWMAAVVLCACVLAPGCKSVPYAELNRAIRANTRGEATTLDKINGVYRVGPPDRIKIVVRDNADLNTETTVRPDGFITFPFSKLHDVYVEGKTPMQLSELLKQELSKYIKEVDVTVEVTGFLSKRIFVFGEVRREGSQPFTGEVTLIEALAGAGAITRRAAASKVLIVRGDPVEPEVFKINVNDIARRADSAQNVLLKKDDIVFVPANIFAKIGYAIDNMLWPFRSIFSVLYTADLATGNR